MRMLPRGLVAVLLVFLGASPRNACALSIRTPAPHLLSLPPRLPRVVDWSELHREQARLAPPRSKLEEERDFFRELFQEVLGRDQGVPVMFEELVGGNQDRGVGVGMGWAGDGAMAARPTVAPRHGVHSEFYATVCSFSSSFAGGEYRLWSGKTELCFNLFGSSLHAGGSLVSGRQALRCGLRLRGRRLGAFTACCEGESLGALTFVGLSGSLRAGGTRRSRNRRGRGGSSRLLPRHSMRRR